MGNIDFYEVDAKYIGFIKQFDARVPNIDYSATSSHNKFLCGVVLSIGIHDYFAPISSFSIPQRTNIIIRDTKSRALGSIRFSFMIPIPQGVATVKNCCNFTLLEQKALQFKP